MGYILEKDGVRDIVSSEVQVNAYVSNGWKVVEESAEEVGSFTAMNEPVASEPVHETERKRPGRKPKTEV